MTTLELMQQLYNDVMKKRKIKISNSEFSELLHKTLCGHFSNNKLQSSKGDNFIPKSDTTNENTQEADNHRFHKKVSNLSNDCMCTRDEITPNKTSDVNELKGRGVILMTGNTLLEHLGKEKNSVKRKEILLILTLMKKLVDNEKTSEEEEKVLEVLRNKDILSGLLNLMRSRDKFVSYAALKSTIAILKCNKFQDSRDSLLQDVLERILDWQHSPHQAEYLDLLVHLMANRCGLDTNRWCCESLKLSDIFTPGFAEHMLSVSEPSIERPHNYLNLVQKTIKYLNKLDPNVRLKEIEAIFPQIGEEFVQFLVHCIQNVNRMFSRLLLRKVLDVFHVLLNYSNLTKVKVIPCVYRETADRLLSAMCPAVLQSMPSETDWVGFGGSKIEGCEFDNRQGDVLLLRKLILLLLKSCAISVRSNSESGVAMVPDCIASLHNIVCRSFPAAQRDLEWLPLVFSDQDDAWIESLLCLLDVYLHSKRSSHTTLPNPHRLFLHFLDGNSRDHMVLVDLLTSPETCFLMYFLRYLKCVASEWPRFVEECHKFFLHEHTGAESHSNSELESDESHNIATSKEKLIHNEVSSGPSWDYMINSGESSDVVQSSKNIVVRRTYLEGINCDFAVTKEPKDIMIHSRMLTGNIEMGTGWSCDDVNQSRDTIAPRTHFQGPILNSDFISSDSSDISESSIDIKTHSQGHKNDFERNYGGTGDDIEQSKDKMETTSPFQGSKEDYNVESVGSCNVVKASTKSSIKYDEIVGPCEAKKVKLYSVCENEYELKHVITDDSSIYSKSNTSGHFVSSHILKSVNDSNERKEPSSCVSETKLKGLACLTVYGSGSDSSEEDCQDSMELSVNNFKSEIQVSRCPLNFAVTANATRECDSTECHIPESMTETQEVGEDRTCVCNPTVEHEDQQSDTYISAESNLKHKLQIDGSIRSCDLQCVELVMSVLIRVRLRIERLREQELFPYKSAPLLSLIEQCEALYEGMDSMED